MTTSEAVNLYVDCPRGKRISVESVAAGREVTCGCGSSVEIPVLSALRRQCGLPAYRPHPAIVIRQRLEAGELALQCFCAECDCPTTDFFHALAECESVLWTQPSGDAMGTIVEAGCAALDIPLLPVDPGPEPEAKGDYLTVPLPVRMCQKCRRRLMRKWSVSGLRIGAIAAMLAGWALIFAWTGWAVLLFPVGGLLWWLKRKAHQRQRAALHRSLREVPEYADLLDRYPEAEILAGDPAESAKWPIVSNSGTLAK